MPLKIFLWSAPRSLSTAFERSMRELEDAKVFHQPFGKAHYFGPERHNPRFEHKEVDDSVSYEEIAKLLNKEFDGTEMVFSKDMAFAVENHFDILLSEGLKDYKHTFIIRSPRKAIPSLYNSSVKGLPGWDYFDPNQAGFKQMHDLYVFVRSKLSVDPVVVDADDLLVDPRTTMKAYCEATGVTFDARMLTWEPGNVSDWDYCDGWHDNVAKSCGFIKRDKEVVQRCPDVSNLPLEVQRLIEDNMKYYAILKENKLNPLTDK